MALMERFSSAWKAFLNKDPTKYEYKDFGPSYSLRPDRPRFTRGIDRTMITSFYNRIAVDCCSVKLQHVKLDSEGRFIEEVNSPLNDCLNKQANVDQTGRDFLRDAVISLLDEGVIAIVPVTTSESLFANETFDIFEMRVGKVLEWFPNDVRVRLYDQESGTFKEKIFPKKNVALPENPFFSIMNEPNSNYKRLVHKLALIDSLDDEAASGKLDMIIQLPYTIRSDARKKQAEERRKDIETQLTNGKYGIAYTDGTEKIIQLNRPVENNLLTQIEYLTKQFYMDLGISEDVMNGTANEEVKNEYFNHLVEPILTEIVESMEIKFLSQNARTRGQSIRYYRQPFRFITISAMAEAADKFTRNEIMTANEIRQIIGLKPSQQEGADDLRNKNNIATPIQEGVEGQEDAEAQPESQFGENEMTDLKYKLNDLKNIDSQINELETLAQKDSDSMVLIHSTYNSKYYDPQKAHEYYEQTKELKGYENRYGGSRGGKKKVTTAGLNEKGKEVAQEVKSNLDLEKKGIQDSNKEQFAKEKLTAREEFNKTITDHSNSIKSSVSALKGKLDKMNPAQRKHAKIQIKYEIEKIKEEADKLRDELRDQYKQDIAQLNENAKTKNSGLKEEYESKYADEITNMLKDPSLVKAPKSSSDDDSGAHKLAVTRKAKAKAKTK